MLKFHLIIALFIIPFFCDAQHLFIGPELGGSLATLTFKPKAQNSNPPLQNENHVGQSSRLGCVLHYKTAKHFSFRTSLAFKYANVSDTDYLLRSVGNFTFLDIESQSNIFYDIITKDVNIHFGLGPNIGWSARKYYTQDKLILISKTENLKNIYYGLNVKMGVSQQQGFGIFTYCNLGMGNRLYDAFTRVRNNDLLGISLNYTFKTL